MAMSINEIWNIDDVNDFIVSLSDYIAGKREDGENITALSAPERIFYITQSLEMEVNNGGFYQFFSSASGDFSAELVQAFTEIGALKTAEICQKALRAFGRELPSDTAEREALLDELECEEIDAILEACDTAFFDYEEDLNALNYAYVLKNKSFFA